MGGIVNCSPGGVPFAGYSDSVSITEAWNGTTLFINIQHPGESPADKGDPKYPNQYSSWPDHVDDNRPRSATVAIRKKDGGIIGL